MLYETINKLFNDPSTFLLVLKLIRFSSRTFRLVSHTNIFYLIMAVYAIRFLAFSFLGNAWLAVPLELLKGVTYSLTYMAASYTAGQMAPAGTEASCQAIAGALYWDLGEWTQSLSTVCTF
ncbi:major facilitator superfamily domain-containing protein 6 [Plakobranchus ocellatus]|uniref:Major facilitator superfamily domain-containing protein 6 n=1 Tax=Plakobranchus ocellatus TaxID=259542 RepID=A0AAV4D4U3_9GAST|nr:major facilitator superfamily domain-containing protein 6 [Plakobranchus ocellatus]